jgi:hypothetical protein
MTTQKIKSYCTSCKEEHYPDSLREDFCNEHEGCICLDCGHVVLNPCSCQPDCHNGSKFMPLNSQEAEAKAISRPELNKFYFERG